MHKEIVDRLSALRERMKSEGVEWYMITGTDAHLSEYVAPHWRTREFISAFTGSAGTVLVSLTGAWLWTDSRYFIQAASQIEGTGIELMRMGMEGVPELEDFILSRRRCSPPEDSASSRRTTSWTTYGPTGPDCLAPQYARCRSMSRARAVRTSFRS